MLTFRTPAKLRASGAVSRLRGLGARTWRRHRASPPGRLPLALLLGVCLVAVTAAVSGASSSVPGLRFAQAGHWVASPDLGSVFHVNGAARSVDAQFPLDGIEPDSQVVQGETSGYVVGRARIVEFGKSDLSVERTITAPTGERPVAIETAGGPYLVYREAGSVVRLGADAAVVPTGGAVGEPVATPDGTIWLHRPDSGAICSLTAGADRISCPAAAPPGHSGALTVVNGRPVFVDTVADTLSPVGDTGLGEAAPAGADLPTGVRVAPQDVSGRVAILDPAASRMYLADASDLGARQASAPVEVALPSGVYAGPTATGSSIVLLELERNSVLTYSETGAQQRVATIPKEVGEPRLHRGEDGRVYVDGAEGRHVLVIDPAGGVGSVPVGGDRPTRPATPAPTGTGDAPGRPVRPAGGGEQRPPRAPDQPRPPPSAAAPDPTSAPPVPASPPGIPRNLRASASGANLTVTWGAAAANGAGVRAYRVSWVRVSGGGAGSVSRAGSARSATLSGLTRGVAYQVSVVAENSAGRGSPATVRATVPAPTPTRTVTVSRGADTTHGSVCRAPDCGWMRVVLRGFAPNTTYKIQPYASGDYTNPGARLSTDGNGNLTTERFAFGSVGQTVWVTVDGVTSNRYRWPAG